MPLHSLTITYFKSICQKTYTHSTDKTSPDAQITELETSDHFKKELEILLPQRLDHFSNSLDKFQKRILS